MILTKDDSWNVLSPTRTGSGVIVEMIKKVYKEYPRLIYLKHITPNDEESLLELPPGSILHQHSTRFIPAKNGRYVISTRNPIDSTLSHCINLRVGVFHFKGEKSECRDLDIEPFDLLPMEFITIYNSMIKWYYNLPKELLNIATIVDYNEFEDNPLKLCSLLNLPEIDETVYNSHHIIKNKGPHSIWIKNWNEIKEVIDSIIKENNLFILEKPWLTKS